MIARVAVAADIDPLSLTILATEWPNVWQALLDELAVQAKEDRKKQRTGKLQQRLRQFAGGK